MLWVVLRLFFSLLAVLVAVGCIDNQPAVQSTSSTSTATSPNTPTPSQETTAATPGTGQAPAETSVATRHLTGDIVLWHSWDGEDARVLRSMLDRMQADNPDLYLDAIYVKPFEVQGKLLQAVLSASGPNLLLAPMAQYPDLATDNLVQPLNSYQERVDEVELLASAWYGNVVDGNLVGLPIWVETVALYVNSDLMAPDQAPKTLAEVLQGNSSFENPIIGCYISPFHLSWGFAAFGSVMLDAEQRVVLDQQSQAEEWLAWLRATRQSGAVLYSTNYSELQQAFRLGELPMVIDGSWALDDYVAVLGKKLRVLPIPAGPTGPARPFINTESFFVVAGQSPYESFTSVEAAITLIELAADSGHTSRGFPAASSDFKDPTRAVREFKALLDDTAPMNVGEENRIVWYLVQEMFLKALMGSEPPAELIANFTLLANEQTGR